MQKRTFRIIFLDKSLRQISCENKSLEDLRSDIVFGTKTFLFICCNFASPINREKRVLGTHFARERLSNIQPDEL